MKIHVATKTKEIINELTTLSKEVIQSDYTPFLGEKSVNDYINGDIIKNYFTKNIDNTHVLQDSNKILGFTVLLSNMIDLFMISTKYHRKGYGSELLKYTEKEIFKSWDMIVLESFTGNIKANNFYLNKGYQIVQEYHDKKNGMNKMIFEKKATS